jgi:hypothetical protein
MELIVVAVAAVLAALRTAPVAATTEVKGQVQDDRVRIVPALPGIWPWLYLDIAITLPVGVTER